MKLVSSSGLESLDTPCQLFCCPFVGSLNITAYFIFTLVAGLGSTVVVVTPNEPELTPSWDSWQSNELVNFVCFAGSHGSLPPNGPSRLNSSPAVEKNPRTYTWFFSLVRIRTIESLTAPTRLLFPLPAFQMCSFQIDAVQC